MMNIILLILQLVIAAFIIRFHTNMYQLGFNPLLSKLKELTDPLVLPFMKIKFIRQSRYDISALIAGFIVALLGAFLLRHNLLDSINIFFSTWINVVFYSIFIVVIGSWLQAAPQQPVMQIALSCSEWLTAPLRKVIPTVGMLDFSPFVALLILSLASQGLAGLL